MLGIYWLYKSIPIPLIHSLFFLPGIIVSGGLKITFLRFLHKWGFCQCEALRKLLAGRREVDAILPRCYSGVIVSMGFLHICVHNSWTTCSTEGCGTHWERMGPKELKWGHLGRLGWIWEPDSPNTTEYPWPRKAALLPRQMTLVLCCLRSCNNFNQGSSLPKECWSSLYPLSTLTMSSDV